MLRYTERQTKKFQKRIVERAQAEGTLDNLFWYVVMSKGGYAYAVSAPKGMVPIVPMGSDPEESRHYADILCELFRTNNRGQDIAVEVGIRSELTQVQWYEFGEMAEWDYVCPGCGAINGDCVCKHVVRRIDCEEEDSA